jgi:hypothetical protein
MPGYLVTHRLPRFLFHYFIRLLCVFFYSVRFTPLYSFRFSPAVVKKRLWLDVSGWYTEQYSWSSSLAFPFLSYDPSKHCNKSHSINECHGCMQWIYVFILLLCQIRKYNSFIVCIVIYSVILLDHTHPWGPPKRHNGSDVWLLDTGNQW